MLQNIRENAQGMIAKTIIVVLILSLSIWGLDSIVGGSGENEIATVNGEAITEQEFERAVQIRRQQRLQEMDNPDSSRIDMDALNEEVMDSLIRDELIGQDIQSRGLQVSAADLDRMITGAEQFRVNGEFSQERFIQAVRNQGMTVDQFRTMLEQDHLSRVIQAVIQGSAFSAPSETERVASLLSQTRDFSVLQVPVGERAESVEVSDEELRSFYEDNKERFVQSESVDAAWITLDRSELVDPADIEEEAVRDRYRERVESMQADQQRNAAHILIREDREDAEAAVEAVQEGLEEGRSFAELAAEYSDDGATAEDGGKLGFSSRDDFDESFSEALFGIEETGEVVGPITTSFGQHFIKLLDTRSEEPPSFESMEASLRETIAKEKAERRYVELSEELADMAYSEYDLEAPAELIDASIQTRDGVRPSQGQAPFDHEGLREQLFTEEVREEGFNTEVVETGDGVSVVARVREYYPRKQQSFEDVRDEVAQLVRQKKAREALGESLESMTADMQADSGLPEPDLETSAEWETFEDVNRRSLQARAVVRDAAFEMPAPQGDNASTRIVDLPSAVALIRLDAVNPPDSATVSMMASNLGTSLGQRHGQMAYRAYIESLRAEADINRD
ncbi:SurA N-terminal domain-containing protein [Vreelandella utahensis]|uniref:SurA N-terminal domain-containing protein n=1 Tax=Vreelandella halophila TaxID=86177 RepID=UPI0015C3F853|nr:SurA N-terminal domain-containing protein [Halomonas utahensis]